VPNQGRPNPFLIVVLGMKSILCALASLIAIGSHGRVYDALINYGKIVTELLVSEKKSPL
jgi:hypothetical protein